MLKTYHRMLAVAGDYQPELKKAIVISIAASTLQGIASALLFPLLATLTSPQIAIDRNAYKRQFPLRKLSKLTGYFDRQFRESFWRRSSNLMGKPTAAELANFEPTKRECRGDDLGGGAGFQQARSRLSSQTVG